MIKHGVHLTVVNYNTFMNSNCLINEVKKAIDIFNNMVHKGVIPNVKSYNIIINGLCKNKMVDEAMNLFKEMHNKEIVPNVVTYGTLIDSFCKSGKISIAWELVDEMHDNLDNAISLVNDIQGQGYQLTVWTYNIMINGFCKDWLFDEALALLSRMEDNGCIPDIVSYETIIYALFEQNERDKAEKLLQKMISRGLILKNGAGWCGQEVPEEESVGKCNGSTAAHQQMQLRVAREMILLEYYKYLIITRIINL
uniref:Pentatricopeptide repeat-containing protein At1g62680, mitochondrial-like n=1 Tax=Cicer arietinum TaxID=3827 RepID=A0A1S3DW11_CICAR|nr:pentatricopeptide repeat-containing protein At1g62680, mitochondrial-like [Cicer arietinum]